MRIMSGTSKQASVGRDEKVVFANGIFDLLHEGHIKVLRFARSLGGRLVVGINSDRATRELKGPARPINSEMRRKAALENLGFVDEVIIFDDIRTTETIRLVKPHIVVKGSEYTVTHIRTIDEIPANIEIVTCPLVTDESGRKISTSSIIAKIKGEAA